MTFRRASSLGAVAAAVALAAVPAAAHATTTFGAPDLGLAANSTDTCAAYPMPSSGPYPTGAGSCTWFTLATGAETDLTRSNIVPEGTGYLTRFRVRAGNQVGPMRVTVMTVLRNVFGGNRTPACCVFKAGSPTFTPTPNAVTTVELANPIPVYNGPTPTPTPETPQTEQWDEIALSVLDPATPIPAAQVTTATQGAAFYPFVSAGERFGQPIVVDPSTGRLNLPTGPMTLVGRQVLLQADWEPGTPPPANGGGGQQPAAPITFPAAPVRVERNVARVPLVCNLDGGCQGVLRLQNAQAKTAHAAKTRTYGTHRFTILPGSTRKVRVELNAAGRRLLKRKDTAKVWANATMGADSARTVTSGLVTLKR